MKKIILFLIITPVIISCQEDVDPEPVNENQFTGTKWTAQDDIASLIYGPGCTTTIEFLTEDECQQIDIIPTGSFAGTEVELGSYSYNGDSVSWTVANHTISGKVTGSVITTTMGTVNGGQRIYTKVEQ